MGTILIRAVFTCFRTVIRDFSSEILSALMCSGLLITTKKNMLFATKNSDKLLKTFLANWIN